MLTRTPLVNTALPSRPNYMTKIYWHGTTSKKKAQSILKNGFSKGTWFADHLENALEFGGKYVFAVVIEWKGKRAYNWQICSANKIAPEKILWLEKFEIKRTNENKELIKDFFRQ